MKKLKMKNLDSIDNFFFYIFGFSGIFCVYKSFISGSPEYYKYYMASILFFAISFLIVEIFGKEEQ